MASIIGRFSVESVLRIAVPALLLLLGLPSAARPEPAPAAGLGFSPAGLTVERDRLYPRHPEPGKFRREINLADGLGGGIYLMAWELDRLSETEWFEAALGPVLLGFRGYEHAWLPGADVAAVVEVPG
ncbi:MAG: hypothetical protein FJ098_14665, partial [Deltaproteobacteria bacterium]|nr:hypothetical protein [Deltaproteobacteria bacterium]